MATEVSYVAYIDESGDDGLARVLPLDPNGASEWFVLGAAVVAAGDKREAAWTKNILAGLKLHQRRVLHFQPLDAGRQYERYINLAPAELREIGPLIPKFEREQEFKPLQAADMLAWHARRYYFEESKGRDPVKHPSNVFFAHMFYGDHDFFDVWDDARLKNAADVLFKAQNATNPLTSGAPLAGKPRP